MPHPTRSFFELPSYSSAATAIVDLARSSDLPALTTPVLRNSVGRRQTSTLGIIQHRRAVWLGVPEVKEGQQQRTRDCTSTSPSLVAW